MKNLIGIVLTAFTVLAWCNLFNFLEGAGKGIGAGISNFF